SASSQSTTTAASESGPSTAPPSTPASSSALFQSTVSPGLAPGPTSSDGSHKSVISMGSKVGIVLGSTLIVLCMAVVLLVVRRRRRPDGASLAAQVDPFLENQDIPGDEVPRPYPIHLYPDPPFSDKRVTALASVRRRYLEHEMRAARERIEHMKSRREWPVSFLSLLRVATRRRTESETISRLREQIAAQEARIQELEAEMTSPWALGLSDEPPPGYLDSQEGARRAGEMLNVQVGREL
ncbi:hypothetical protein FB45DRAFT_1108950, partial [Roridomyces roridus]